MHAFQNCLPLGFAVLLKILKNTGFWLQNNNHDSTFFFHGEKRRHTRASCICIHLWIHGKQNPGISCAEEALSYLFHTKRSTNQRVPSCTLATASLCRHSHPSKVHCFLVNLQTRPSEPFPIWQTSQPVHPSCHMWLELRVSLHNHTFLQWLYKTTIIINVSLINTLGHKAIYYALICYHSPCSNLIMQKGFSNANP